MSTYKKLPIERCETPTVKILHLSDLQFGKSNRFVGKKRYLDNTNYKIFAESIVSDVLKTW